MGIKASVSYPWISSKAVDGTAWRVTVPARIGRGSPAQSVRAVAITAACLIEAILILGFVAASLGVGQEGQPRVGPDRPPPPVTPAPAPPPDPPRVLAVTLVAGWASRLLAGGAT